jgi:hypothetical protein
VILLISISVVVCSLCEEQKGKLDLSACLISEATERTFMEFGIFSMVNI